MSVGLQRLRDEPDVIRDGAIDKGEDPALVDRALELDARAAPAPRRERDAQGRAERRVEADRRGDQGRVPPRTAPRSPSCKAASAAAGERITTLDASLAEIEADARRPAPAHPEPARPRHPGRWRGGQRHDPDLGRAAAHAIEPLAGEVGADAPAGATTWTRKPHWELGEALDILDNARGAKISRLRLPGLQGRGLGAPARADQLVPRRPHPRERLHRGLAAGRRQHGLGARHRADPGQGRPDVRRHPRRAVPGPDGRGPGHEPPPRRDPRRRPSCRSATPPTRRASAARPARPARTPAASCASTSSTRSRWSCSRSPEDSAAALEWMTERAEILLQRLGLAYRVLLMSTREMGFTQARKYDLEVWAPGVERWLEVSSCSNFRDYQARRMAIRYRPEPGAKPELVHTLNGSGLALARDRGGHPRDVPAAGRHVTVPEVLRPYLGRDVIAPSSRRMTRAGEPGPRSTRGSAPPPPRRSGARRRVRAARSAPGRVPHRQPPDHVLFVIFWMPLFVLIPTPVAIGVVGRRHARGARRVRVRDLGMIA